MHFFEGTNGKPRLLAGLVYRLLGLRKSKTGQRGHYSLASHLVCRLSVDRRARYALMTERLLDDCQIDVCAYQREGTRKEKGSFLKT
jgi:hypothetical protein